jgi:hypothetical protein
MNKCIKCDVDLDNQRAHLGYTECLECSDVEAYSAHTVYPHKTGGYVQPVSKEKSKHLRRLDRRSVGNTRSAKGIYADNSWDRWLEQYYHNLYNPKPKREIVKDVCTIKHMNYDTLYNKTVLYYKDNGYNNTVKYLKELYGNDKISMTNKSKVINELNNLEVIPKRLRKWIIHEDS